MIRVRFAPSPTGALHIGGVRTALYNYFFARQNGGKFIIRIEDTDSTRYVEGAEEYIFEALQWCGIEVDEGVRESGPYAPYRQSERRAIYLQYAMQLIDSGDAYYAFDTADELEALRREYEADGRTFAYNYEVRTKLATSLNLSQTEVKERIARGDVWVIRFKMAEDKVVKMHDLIRGDIEVNTSTLDDKVLYKSVDALPTYHLANIVDDHLMQISHVIRGEEWLPSLPLHYELYRSFGWSDSQPLFAHLPLLLKPTGQGKLSKRDGDKMGFPVFPLEWKSPETGEISHGYREDGYFPEAFVNMLSLLGWNEGNTEQEIYSMEELIKVFSLDRVGKAGARFNPDKARWFQQQYMHIRDNEDLVKLYEPILEEHNVELSHEKMVVVVNAIKQRATFPAEFWGLSDFLFVAPTIYDEKAVAKYWKEDTPEMISGLRNVLADIDDWHNANMEAICHEWIVAKEYKMGAIMNAFRLAIVGESRGFGMYEMCEVLGKDETLLRLDNALRTL